MAAQSRVETRVAGPLIVCPLNARNWILVEPFAFDTRSEGVSSEIEVPRMFVTDFASIPRILWPLLPNWGDYGWAAVIHDFLYWDQSRSRPYADEVLRDAMRRSGVLPLRQFLIYWGVRLFGGRAWSRNKRMKAKDPQVRFAGALPGNPFGGTETVARINAVKKAV